MKAGDIIFLKPTGLIGYLITKIDGGAFSHVAVAVSTTHIIEAQYHTKSRIWPVYEGRSVTVMDLGLTDEQRERLIHNSISLVGRWYDYRLLVHYFIKNVFRWNFKAIWNSQNNLICSELASTLLLSIGFSGATGLRDKNITPRELFEFLMELQLQKQEAEILVSLKGE